VKIPGNADPCDPVGAAETVQTTFAAIRLLASRIQSQGCRWDARRGTRRWGWCRQRHAEMEAVPKEVTSICQTDHVFRGWCAEVELERCALGHSPKTLAHRRSPLHVDTQPQHF
jgi:hypothetical protein